MQAIGITYRDGDSSVTERTISDDVCRGHPLGAGDAAIGAAHLVKDGVHVRSADRATMLTVFSLPLLNCTN